MAQVCLTLLPPVKTGLQQPQCWQKQYQHQRESRKHQRNHQILLALLSCSKQLIQGQQYIIILALMRMIIICLIGR